MLIIIFDKIITYVFILFIIYFNSTNTVGPTCETSDGLTCMKKTTLRLDNGMADDVKLLGERNWKNTGRNTDNWWKLPRKLAVVPLVMMHFSYVLMVIKEFAFFY